MDILYGQPMHIISARNRNILYYMYHSLFIIASIKYITGAEMLPFHSFIQSNVTTLSKSRALIVINVKGWGGSDGVTFKSMYEIDCGCVACIARGFDNYVYLGVDIKIASNVLKTYFHATIYSKP